MPPLPLSLHLFAPSVLTSLPLILKCCTIGLDAALQKQYRSVNELAGAQAAAASPSASVSAFSSTASAASTSAAANAIHLKPLKSSALLTLPSAEMQSYFLHAHGPFNARTAALGRQWMAAQAPATAAGSTGAAITLRPSVESPTPLQQLHRSSASVNGAVPPPPPLTPLTGSSGGMGLGSVPELSVLREASASFDAFGAGRAAPAASVVAPGSGTRAPASSVSDGGVSGRMSVAGGSDESVGSGVLLVVMDRDEKAGVRVSAPPPPPPIPPAGFDADSKRLSFIPPPPPQPSAEESSSLSALASAAPSTPLRAWPADTVLQWLRANSLAPAFVAWIEAGGAANAVDGALLSELDEAMLVDAGVSNRIHRVKVSTTSISASSFCLCRLLLLCSRCLSLLFHLQLLQAVQALKQRDAAK